MAGKKSAPSAKSLSLGDRTALLVIDVQNGLFERPIPIYQAGPLLDTLCRLIERARAAQVPVVFVQHTNANLLPYGTPAWSIHSRLAPEPGDLSIHKQHGNSFEDTPLAAELEARQVGALVVTGLVSHGCVRATCLGARALGYRVILVSDGHSNYHKQPAETIAQTHAELQAAGVELLAAAEITF